LVTLNGVEFTANDYKAWWKNWQEEGDKLPATPDQFIEWQLMAQEALDMQFDQDPSYQKKLLVFLQVRSLMLLKNEEIDSKNVISDQEAWEVYEQEYCPRLRLAALIFTDQQNAEQKMQSLKDGKTTFDQLVAVVPTEAQVQAGETNDSGPQGYDEKVVRLKNLEQKWRNSLEGAKIGDLIGPLQAQHIYTIVKPIEILGPSQEDFAQVKKRIVEKLAKKNSQNLTEELFNRLMKKYMVKVDEELLAAIDGEDLSEEDGKKILISTTKEPISVGDFVNIIKKDAMFRAKYKFAKQELERNKKRILLNVLSQTLISWESMARHYEEKEPLKQTFDFYRRHRLVSQLKSQLINPEAEITEEDVKKYYDENDAILTSPEIVSFMMIKGEPELIEKIDAEINKGSSFSEVAEKTFPGEMPVRQVPVADLDNDLRKVVESLRVGEISKPFQHQDMLALVRLVGRTTPKKVPYQHVREQLTSKLKDEKYARVKKNLLDNLRKRSQIEINYKEWERLHKELEESYATKQNN
ncbi:MAG: peptidylprolyl isomerase, partial [Desulfobulbaceae bacterium]|nr:peptidylprolyl isomerase [Desulfobulbaceae bacterium]HIJ77676.1 peptidyl-prolyl cis-trans isomerase [Deltaproteobacteria bacterium]